MYRWDYAAPTGFALASGLRPEGDVGFSEAGRGLSGALSVIHWSLEDRIATVWLDRPHFQRMDRRDARRVPTG